MHGPAHIGRKMDDGSRNKNGFNLHTQSFSLSEIQLLRKRVAFATKFDLDNHQQQLRCSFIMMRRVSYIY
jgi:hypothetical protein